METPFVARSSTGNINVVCEYIHAHVGRIRFLIGIVIDGQALVYTPIYIYTDVCV